MNAKKHTKQRLTVIFTSVVAFIMMATVVYADTTITDPPNAWDMKSLKYENGNVTIFADSGWTPHYVEVGFDNDVVATSCGDSAFAGTAEVGHFHVDNNPSGALGWQSTRNWKLVGCDRDNSGTANNADLSLSPPERFDIVYDDLGTYFTVDSQDVVDATSCGGNCDTEIVTMVSFNLDADCDGSVDMPLPDEGLCLYWEAERPFYNSADADAWGGNFQTRINSGGGDKTLNFKIEGADVLSVGMSAFEAETSSSTGLLLTAVAVLMGISVITVRRGKSSAV